MITHRLSITLLLLLLFASACQRQVHTVRYEVSGTATEIGVAYRNASNALEELDVTPPWNAEIQVQTWQRVMLSARNRTQTGFVKCRIVVDGEVLSEGESAGAFKVARCEGTVRLPNSTSASTALGDTTAAIATTSAAGPSPCTMKSDTVLARNAVGPSWIPWNSSCLPEANLVYVDRNTWDIWVMDELGGNKRCLTCYNDNILGLNFPLDEDGQSPEVHWKGDPEAHPTQPIIFLKAENQHSAHRVLQNAPSFGWDNDIWALNVCTRRYSRLTQLAPGQGVQNTGIANDGRWYVYPLRYQVGTPLKNFGLARMVFGELAVDENGDTHLRPRFEAEPNGQMYYEPHSIHQTGSETYTLLYTAGPGNMLDPYRYDWTCGADSCQETNIVLQTTPSLHEEFTKFSPGGGKIAWMRGPVVGFGYHADLYVSAPDFSGMERVTWYSDCETWPDRCQSNGAQLSRLDWKDDGTAVFFGLWILSGPLRPPSESELHRLDFSGQCGSAS